MKHLFAIDVADATGNRFTWFRWANDKHHAAALADRDLPAGGRIASEVRRATEAEIAAGGQP